MADTYDVAIVGLGAMGSAAAYQLARRGQRVLGVDRHAPPHAHGSSHGRTRMIREAYYEHPLYVPLVQRAYALWSALEKAAGGRRFFLRTGGLMVGHEAGTLVGGALRSAALHRLPHELLQPGKLRRNYPAFAPLDDMVGVFEPRAGILLPEAILKAQLDLAEHHGATLRRNTVVHGWAPSADGVVLRIGDDTVLAKQVVVAAGGWTGPLLPELALPLVVERQVIHWFEPARNPEVFTAQRMPVSLWQLEHGAMFYTKPDLGDGVKVGVHHDGATVTAETVDRRVSEAEDAHIVDLLRRFVPFAKGTLRERAVCTYTNTPDAHFIIDRHPDVPQVLLLSPCSGHGFKFASVIGEIAADLVVNGACGFDVSPFALARFGRSDTASQAQP